MLLKIYLMNEQEAVYSNFKRKVYLLVWFSGVQLILDSRLLLWSGIWIYDLLGVSVCISIVVH